MTNSVMSTEQKVRVPWKRIYTLILLVFLAMIGCRVYTFAMNKIVMREQTSLQNEIAAKNAEIQKANTSVDYTTYVAGDKLLATQNSGSWLDRISRVIQIFTTLQSLGGGNVVFSDFKIDFDQISLMGSVPNLSYIYAKDGVIDQFTTLDFIKDVSIKDYKKNGDVFAFTLTADISLHGTGSNQ